MLAENQIIEALTQSHDMSLEFKVHSCTKTGKNSYVVLYVRVTRDYLGEKNATVRSSWAANIKINSAGVAFVVWREAAD